jgi:hypothetical protein
MTRPSNLRELELYKHHTTPGSRTSLADYRELDD